ADIHLFGDYRRFRAWVLAAATALLGTQLLQGLAIVALDRSIYLAPEVNWAGHIVGGGMLGFGMVLAGGCPSRNPARAGGGDLRSLLSLIVLGLVAYMTTGGLLAYPRAVLGEATSAALGRSTQGLGELVAAIAGLSLVAANALVSGCIGLAAGIYCFRD